MKSVLVVAFLLTSYSVGIQCLSGYSAYDLSAAQPSYLDQQSLSGLQSGGMPLDASSDGLVAAIRGSQRNVKVIDVPSNLAYPAESMTIHVPPSSQPLTFVLRSKSSQLKLQSTHEADPGSYQETSSEDQPHVLVHTVTRPVLQEIREIIAPYRKVTQEIKPVQESAETLVARAQGGSGLGGSALGGNALAGSGLGGSGLGGGMASGSGSRQLKPAPKAAPMAKPGPQAMAKPMAKPGPQAIAKPMAKPMAIAPAPAPKPYPIQQQPINTAPSWQRSSYQKK